MLRISLRPFLATLALFLLPISIQVAFAENFSWRTVTTIPGGQYWSAATSEDGSVLVASARNVYIQRSSNSGSTWSQAAGTFPGTYFFAISSDGSKIFAAGNEGGYNYTSTDSGATWTSRSIGATNMFRPCMSDDGQNLMIAVWNGYPRYSSDGGATWANVPGLSSASWYGCAMSFDGTKRYITNSSNTVFRSSDSGATWQSVTMPFSGWSDIAVSSDGSIVYVSSSSSIKIYKSTDSGQTFASTTNGTVFASPKFISTSSDGSVVAVFDNGSSIKTSLNGGSTWTSEVNAGVSPWYAGDLNGSGTKLIAPMTVNGSYLYKSTYIPPSTLVLTSGGASQIQYGIQNSISATTNFAGKVTFFANGKRIAKCVSVPTVSLVATCNYKPTIHGAVTVTATFVPSNSSYASTSAELFRTKIYPRSSIR